MKVFADGTAGLGNRYPRPWCVSDRWEREILEDLSTVDHRGILDSNGEVVIDIVRQIPTAADAEILYGIVRAINAYEPMGDALRLAVCNVESRIEMQPVRSSYIDRISLIEERDRYAAALAQARGESS